MEWAGEGVPCREGPPMQRWLPLPAPAKVLAYAEDNQEKQQFDPGTKRTATCLASTLCVNAIELRQDPTPLAPPLAGGAELNWARRAPS